MNKLLITLLFTVTVVCIAAQAQRGYYYDTADHYQNLYRPSWSIGSFGIANGGSEWNVLSYTFGDRMNITPSLIGKRQRFSNRFDDDTGEGIVAFPTMVQYPVCAFGSDADSGFKPLYFAVSPFFETALIGWYTEKPYFYNYEGQPNGIGILFPYLDLGVRIQSSFLFAKLSYTLVQDTERSYEYGHWGEKRISSNNSGLSISAGVNLSLMNKSAVGRQRVKKKIYTPIISITDTSLHGTSGNRISQTDTGHLKLLLENTSKVDGDNLKAVLKPDGNYPGLSTGSSFSFNIKAKDSYVASIPITTKDAIPSDTQHTLEISPANNEYKIELPVTITLSPDPKGSAVATQSVVYNPSELDRYIPQRQVQNPNLKAVLVINENYRNESVEPIKVGSNAAKTLKKYLIQTLGINEANIYVYKDYTISQLEDLVDPDEGLISNIVGKNDQLLLYIISHGITKQGNRDNLSYLLGTDSNPYSAKRPGVSIRSIISDLEEIPMQNYVLFIDACYSGLSKGTMAPTTRLKSGSLSPSNGVVITSSEGDEVSNIMEDKGHTVFSYHLMKALQSLGKGKDPISVQALFNELGDRDDGIPGYTLRQFNRTQTPRLFGDNQIILSK